jgi:hypothetical protein
MRAKCSYRHCWRGRRRALPASLSTSCMFALCRAVSSTKYIFADGTPSRKGSLARLHKEGFTRCNATRGGNLQIRPHSQLSKDRGARGSRLLKYKAVTDGRFEEAVRKRLKKELRLVNPLNGEKWTSKDAKKLKVRAIARTQSHLIRQSADH